MVRASTKPFFNNKDLDSILSAGPVIVSAGGKFALIAALPVENYEVATIEYRPLT